MHLDGSGTIFQIIRGRYGLSGKLSLFTDQYKGLMIIVCDRCSEDKSAGLGTYYHIIIQILDLLLHGIDRQVQSVRILQYTCDITENDTLLREIGNALYIFFQLFHDSTHLSLI